MRRLNEVSAHGKCNLGNLYSHIQCFQIRFARSTELLRDAPAVSWLDLFRYRRQGNSGYEEAFRHTTAKADSRADQFQHVQSQEHWLNNGACDGKRPLGGKIETSQTRGDARAP